MFMSAMVRIFSWGERLIVPFNEAIAELFRIHLKPKVNYTKTGTKSFLTNGNCEGAMEKLLHS